MYFESFVRSWWSKIDQMMSVRGDELGVNTDAHTYT